MAIITAHWSATAPVRLHEYHIEFGVRAEVAAKQLAPFDLTMPASRIDFAALQSLFTINKNYDFSTATGYGTWKMNHDPRDHSPNIEIAAMCMGGSNVGISQWGTYPFTCAHAWMMAALMARVAALKKIDTGGSFDGTAFGFINNPIANLSTHAERALQTPSPDATVRPNLGYFLYSGDPDCRWDLAALDPSKAGVLGSADTARTSAIASASWLRSHAHDIKSAGILDFWGLDKNAT
jgi:hypothetical protein